MSFSPKTTPLLKWNIGGRGGVYKPDVIPQEAQESSRADLPWQLVEVVVYFWQHGAESYTSDLLAESMGFRFWWQFTKNTEK